MQLQHRPQSILDTQEDLNTILNLNRAELLSCSALRQGGEAIKPLR